MLLNRREDSTDLEKGLPLILFELEESRSSVVFRQASYALDKIDDEISRRRRGVDSFSGIARRTFRTDFVGRAARGHR